MDESRRHGLPSTLLTITAIVTSIAAGGLLLAAMVALLVIGGPLTTPLGGLASGLGFVAVTSWLSHFVRRCIRSSRPNGSDGGEGGGGGPRLDPTPPCLPPGEPEWWPQFEHDLRAYLDERDRIPVAG